MVETFLGARDSNTPVGSILLKKGLISEAELDRALAIQKSSGGRIGTILVGEGFVKPQPLARVIAEHHHLAFVDLTKDPADPSLLDARDVMRYLELEALPWKTRDGITCIATTDVSFSTINWAREKYGQQFELIITSPRDIAWTIQKLFGTTLDFDSRQFLHKYFPHYSTFATLSQWNINAMIAAIALFVFLLSLIPEIGLAVLFILTNLIYFATIVLKVIAFEKGCEPTPAPADLHISDSELPIYTVLIPMFKEAETLPHLLDSIRGLDYPRAKLDVKLIIESDDEETYEAAKTLEPEGVFDIIRVPFSLPRTKPKACNYALRFARGEYVTIFDAEDRPDPKQLRKAVQAFRTLPEDIVCLQGRLNYYNRDDNMLTQFFAIEYAAWFDFMLKGLERLHLPIPLGGTSNHIALSRLRAIGEWDPYNVTEDADLGVRLALAGHRTAVLNSLTLEEAPARIGGWMRQRSRWIKGYMQTWLVHMRHPEKLRAHFGWRGLAGFHLFIGGPCVVFLSAPILWIVSLCWGFGLLQDSYYAVPGWAIALSLFNLIFGFFAHAWFAFGVVKARRWPHMSLAIVLFPLYWILHSFASFKALWQLLTNPFFWEKTTHGLSATVAPTDKMRQEFQ